MSSFVFTPLSNSNNNVTFANGFWKTQKLPCLYGVSITVDNTEYCRRHKWFCLGQTQRHKVLSRNFIKMFIVVTATKTIESIDKEQKAGISMNGCFLTNLRCAYDAFDFSYQRNAMNGTC